MFRDELAIRANLSAEPEAAKASATGLRVVVVGLGVSGIIAAHHLTEMGADFVVVEKQSRTGGNWWQNKYPGAGVDTPSQLYSLSFAPHDWSSHYELRDNLQKYFEHVVEKEGLASRTRFDTEVVSAAFDEDAAVWKVSVRDASGRQEVLTADLVITAVGVLNRPSLPNVPGVESFRGVSFHSSEWPEDLDLRDKRVAVAGSGASAMQIVPAIADQVAQLTVFQRSPQWIAPFVQFQKTIDPGERLLLDVCPIYRAWYWMRLFWLFGDRVISSVRVDKTWPHPERSVNRRNDRVRESFIGYIKEQLGDRQDLSNKVVPTYPPYGKRILLDNGWYRTLTRENVELVESAAVAVEPDALVASDGTKYAVDVIVWATGFDAARYIASMAVKGRNGLTLREAWDDDDPQAYLGVAVPKFPNFFMLGGPNSLPGSGSFMYQMELQMRYIRRLIFAMLNRGARTIEVTGKSCRLYNLEIDRLHATMVWSHPGMTTYYRNARGRVVFLTPFLNVDYWERTQRADLEHYKLSFAPHSHHGQHSVG
jgi:4-hydroxyacetophenone monooxygenase